MRPSTRARAGRIGSRRSFGNEQAGLYIEFGGAADRSDLPFVAAVRSGVAVPSDGMDAMTRIGDPYRCDGASCGKLRENDANHWWLLWRGFVSGTLMIERWNAKVAACPGVKHFCGIDCLTKAVTAGAAELLEEARNSAK
jgi:hypothetical protein